MATHCKTDQIEVNDDASDNVTDDSDNDDDNDADKTQGVSHFVSHSTSVISSLFYNFSLLDKLYTNQLCHGTILTIFPIFIFQPW